MSQKLINSTDMPLSSRYTVKLFASFTSMVTVSMVTVSLAKPAENSTLLTLVIKISVETRLVVFDIQDLANTTQPLVPVNSEVTVILHTRLKQTRICK